MDSVLGIRYNGGVILATDQSNTRSILVYQSNLDKIIPLTTHSALAVAGPACDRDNFSDYISKNLQLYEYSNHGCQLSPRAQAHFAREIMATALRKGPYQVNVLLGGYDTVTNQASLYWMDYLAALTPVPYGAQGYAAYFCLGLMDRLYPTNKNECKEDKDLCSYEQAMDIINACIKEIQTRFLPSQPNFIIKNIDKEGINVVSFGSDPADT